MEGKDCLCVCREGHHNPAPVTCSFVKQIVVGRGIRCQYPELAQMIKTANSSSRKTAEADRCGSKL
jgi:hypothetical protein